MKGIMIKGKEMAKRSRDVEAVSNQVGTTFPSKLLFVARPSSFCQLTEKHQNKSSFYSSFVFLSRDLDRLRSIHLNAAHSFSTYFKICIHLGVVPPPSQDDLKKEDISGIKPQYEFFNSKSLQAIAEVCTRTKKLERQQLSTQSTERQGPSLVPNLDNPGGLHCLTIAGAIMGLLLRMEKMVRSLIMGLD